LATIFGLPPTPRQVLGPQKGFALQEIRTRNRLYFPQRYKQINNPSGVGKKKNGGITKTKNQKPLCVLFSSLSVCISVYAHVYQNNNHDNKT